MTTKIEKQLNIITKNIESTTKNINDSEKFYSKFFKNIINKETQININNKTANNNINSSGKKIHSTNIIQNINKKLNPNKRKNSK